MSLGQVTCGWWWMYSTSDWTINCSSSCQPLFQSKAHVKSPTFPALPQTVTVSVGWKQRRRKLWFQRNTTWGKWSVWQRGLLCLLSWERAIELLFRGEILADTAHVSGKKLHFVVCNSISALPWGGKKENLVNWGGKLHSQEISSFSELKQEETIARDDENTSWGEGRRGEARRGMCEHQEKATLREANQAVSRRPLLLGELWTRGGFLALPHCWHIWPVPR